MDVIAAYQEALKERTRERAPLEWAATQNDLGVALAKLAERDNRPGRLEKAITAYREALKEPDTRTRAARMGGDAKQSRRSTRPARRTGR